MRSAMARPRPAGLMPAAVGALARCPQGYVSGGPGLVQPSAGSQSSHTKNWSSKIFGAASCAAACVACRANRSSAKAEETSEAQVTRDMWMDMQGEHEWLEEVLGERALEWVREGNSRTESKLGNPKETALYDRILKILESKEKIPQVRKLGDYWYNFWTDAENPRGVWRRTTPESYKTSSPEWELVLDVDALGKKEGESWVWKGSNVLREYDPKTGKPLPPRRAMLSLSPGGSDAVVCREFDLISKSFIAPEDGGFCVTPAMKSRVAWVNADTMLVGGDFGEGSLTTSGYPCDVRKWTRGTPLSEAEVVYKGEKTDVAVGGYLGRHRGHIFEWRYRTPTFFTTKEMVRLGSVTSDEFGEWIDLNGLGLPESAKTSQFADQLLIMLRKEWQAAEGKTYPAGSLLSVKLKDFGSEGGHANFKVLFEPSPTTSLEDFTITKNYLVLEVLEKVKSRLHFWQWKGDDAGWGDVVLEPEAVIRGCGVTAIDAEDGDEVFVNTSTFTQPATLSIANASDGATCMTGAQALKSMPAYFNADDIEAFQAEATSKDGTKVPYFVVCRKGLPRDGSTPTILYGYGGFEISMLPGYRAVTGAGWLEAGGCWVLSNIRGGAEFGPSWHQAALRENRQRAYDDFIAIAEDLIDQGITTSDRLGISGGSNGGLLVGNIMVQRPDILKAVHCAVPLLDMKRFSHLLAGASWMAEYGNPDTDDWKFLQKYSPYHNLSPRPDYPWLLMTTSTKDDRVHPYHARSFVKRLGDLGKGDKVFYYENIEGGHGGAADAKQQAYMTTLSLNFFKR
eukprot:CAMPEP_0178428938 /NCGR_PEP_ID=MMETSP0689_2-20121128/30541_1 /TAXON_ID=160604 /ORGANISM="Amphidinium massartii, Strain CS-259" /LENGTH=792 /DNA_ID=CAMNT_0020050737 /DNA_START=41 /DNA_END=2415 /DNA_ORIENTATION=-